ncbi:MAG: twin-arginine translocase TatA/TatE family subunit [Chloroflexota bacterium]
MDLFGMGPGEILIILVVALLVFGPERIVDVGRSLGRFSRRVSQAGRDFTRALEEEVDSSKAPQQVQKPAEKPQGQQQSR